MVGNIRDLIILIILVISVHSVTDDPTDSFEDVVDEVSLC
jgi:hypothetical protein